MDIILTILFIIILSGIIYGFIMLFLEHKKFKSKQSMEDTICEKYDCDNCPARLKGLCTIFCNTEQCDLLIQQSKDEI